MMRLTFVALAFLFFINVLATPIHPSRGNVMALRRRSPNEHNTPGNNAAAKCKRATPDELTDTLKTMDKAVTIQEGKDASVYSLPATMKVDNENVILKVINNNDKNENAEREAWANHNVGQLLGWAHTPNKALTYLFIKNMGVEYWNTGLNDDQLKQLYEEAKASYQSQYHLTHSDPHELNFVFRIADGKWRAELVDWRHFIEEKGYKHYTNPPEPFEIDPKCVFVPRLMKKWVES
ncbi:hypothetical protein AX14_005103 [Amanita brunnescens Koide BX004]|nr:hypothetical protein AX14_005103 [Amanita brunnescens Koide BX004]